jgi:uncharacterized membrane protein
MPSFLKTILVILGSVLIGIGIGLIVAENYKIEKNYYWLFVIFSLILGGFFLGFGAVGSEEKEKKQEEGENF